MKMNEKTMNEKKMNAAHFTTKKFGDSKRSVSTLNVLESFLKKLNCSFKSDQQKILAAGLLLEAERGRKQIQPVTCSEPNSVPEWYQHILERECVEHTVFVKAGDEMITMDTSVSTLAVRRRDPGVLGNWQIKNSRSKFTTCREFFLEKFYSY